MAAPMPSMQSKEAWKGALAPGELACKLGLKEPPTNYIDGKVSKTWATRLESNTLLSEGKEEEPVLTPADAEERWKRIQDVDGSCAEVLEQSSGDVATLDEWKSMMLVDNETEVMMLPCIAFSGMPAQPKGIIIGQGMLLLSKVKDPETGSKYRLHFVMKNSQASMEAEETWGEQTKGCCCCCKSTGHQVQSDYTSKHAMDMLGSSMDLDGNLFHVHYQVKDEATLVSTFGGGFNSGQRGGCSCCSCGGSCCSCSCCGSCFSCCGLCCVNKNTNKNTGGYWSSTTSFEDTLDFHTTVVAQEMVKAETFKFPNLAPVQHEMERAAITKKLHTITLKYRCTKTNDVQTCEIVVKPDEKISNIGKLTSWLSNKVSEVPERLITSAGGSTWAPSAWGGSSTTDVSSGAVVSRGFTSSLTSCGRLQVCMPRSCTEVMCCALCAPCYVCNRTFKAVM
jgi:hypothetical protein